MMYEYHPQIGWSGARTATGQALRPPEDLAWITCPWCWGQRIILVPDDDGLQRCSCPTCLGIGEVLRGS
jgi:hypothetical protein